MLKKITHEPLVQFIFIGLILFAADQYVLGNREDPRHIVIDQKQKNQLATIFEEGKGRLPDATELDELIVKWTQNEILYREARLMGLDKGDEMVRQRLILKMRNVLFNSLTTETPNDSELVAWFEENRDAYDKPALYDFEQFPLPSAGNPEQDRLMATNLANEIGQQDAPEQYRSVTRRYFKRPGINLVSVFGEDDGQQLVAAPTQQWLAVQSQQGWHLARIIERHAPVPASFAEVRALVATDWTASMTNLELSRAVKEIADQYELEMTFSNTETHAEENPDLIPATAANETSEGMNSLTDKSLAQK